MARSINDIQTLILTKCIEADSLPATAILTDNEKETLQSLTNTSKVSIFRAFIYVVAVCIWSLEKLLDIFKNEEEQVTREVIPFSKDYWVKTVLEYQHGDVLQRDGTYDNTQLTQAEIAEHQIVERSACEATNYGLQIKAAKLVEGELVKLDEAELQGLDAYVKKQGAAGIPVSAFSDDPDDIKLSLEIWFDSTKIAANGARLDGSDDTPHITALQEYLKDKNLADFNGEISLQDLADVERAVDGFEDVFVIWAVSRYGGNNYNNEAVLAYEGRIDRYRVPHSGYFKLDVDNSIFTFKKKL